MAKTLNVGKILSASVSNLNTPAMQIVEIPLAKLLDNEGNFFKVEDVQELADDIEMRGLENPLTVCEAENGCYRIVAGHRRRKALEQIGKTSAPCFVKAYADADSEEVALIQSNLTARELTYYEKMLAVVRLEEALRRMKENGVELPGRLRDHLAEKSGESASAVHRMTYIYKHLSPELMEGLRQEKINESIAYEPQAARKRCRRSSSSGWRAARRSARRTSRLRGISRLCRTVWSMRSCCGISRQDTKPRCTTCCMTSRTWQRSS